MKMPKFPLFIDLTEKKILIAGGGSVAARRVNTLLRYGADVTVIAPEIHETIEKAAAAGALTVHRRVITDDDIGGQFMVLACTNRPEINAVLTRLARESGSLAGNASDQADCDFFFPAVVLGQGLSIGICGTGEDHAAVARAAGQIREIYEKPQNGGNEP